MKLLIRSLSLTCALPFGFFLCLYNLLLLSTTKFHLNNPKALPSNAILFGTHTQLYLHILNPEIRRTGCYASTWLGFHGFAPYIFAIWDKVIGIDFFLYENRHATKFTQIVKFLEKNPTTRFGLATDSGGPYGKVRPSLLSLAIKTKRPVASISTRCSRSITLFQHKIPLPFSRFETSLGDLIEYETLRSLDRDTALQFLQNELDAV